MSARVTAPFSVIVFLLSSSPFGCSSRVHDDPVDGFQDGRLSDASRDDSGSDGVGYDMGRHDLADTVSPDLGGDTPSDLQDAEPKDLADVSQTDGQDDHGEVDVEDIGIDSDTSDDSSDVEETQTPDTAQPTCGDGVVEGTEQCDELNEIDGDGCDTDCTYTEILKVEAGYNFACALIEGGRVRCWGQNHSGQLGLGHTSTIGDDETPASGGDLSLPIAAKDLTVGDAHSCILTVDDDIMCWGMGGNGRLGYGNTNTIGDDEFLTNLAAVPVGGKVAEVRAGGAQTCARLFDGTMRCWGVGGSGLLGYGNVDSIGDDETPSSAGNVPIGAAVLTLQTGVDHSCAITADNAVRCWGSGVYGALGYANKNVIGDNEPVSSAGAVSCLPQGAAQGTKPVALAASFFTCALYSSGDVLCWGPNTAGELGQGNTVAIGDDEVPSDLSPIALGGKAESITIGDSHACALLDDHKVRCWGRNQFGELGQGNTIDIGDDEVPNSVGAVDFDIEVRYLDAGSLFTCAISITNELRCWGKNHNGQLGQGDNDPLPDGLLPGDLPPVQLL